MKYLAIDYGQKKIGLAISDSAGRVAMPLQILDNNNSLLKNLEKIIKENEVGEIVLGQSENLSGGVNKIQSEIDKFIIDLEKLNLKINLINEIFTSMEAKWGVEKNIRRSNKKNKKQIKKQRVDDKAASLILKTFLEKLN